MSQVQWNDSPFEQIPRPRCIKLGPTFDHTLSPPISPVWKNSELYAQSNSLNIYSKEKWIVCYTVVHVYGVDVDHWCEFLRSSISIQNNRWCTCHWRRWQREPASRDLAQREIWAGMQVLLDARSGSDGGTSTPDQSAKREPSSVIA